MLVAHIVQAGHLLVPAAAVAAKTTRGTAGARLLPIIIVVGLLFMLTRYRQRGRRGGSPPSGPTGRPRSARQAMRQPAPPRESDTDPESRSEHTDPE